MKLLAYLILGMAIGSLYQLMDYVTSEETQRFGVVMRLDTPEDNAVGSLLFKQFERACALAQVSPDSLTQTGMEASTGMFFCVTKNHSQAIKVQQQLLSEGYKSEVIEIIENGPNMNVITFAQINQINESFKATLDKLNSDVLTNTK